MPIYEYLCRSCGHVLDALQKLSDDPLVHCPTCGEAELKRQLSAPRFRLKGSGWYETDFKGKNDRKRNIAGDGKDPDSGGGADKKAGDKAGDKAADKPADKGSDKPAKSGEAATAAKPAAGKAGDVA
jgi:putative FmdB family regulatory protein